MVYRFCGRQSIAVIHYKMVFNGHYFGKVGGKGLIITWVVTILDEMRLIGINQKRQP